jgi:carbohydrate-selective porin OprB
MNNSLHSLAPVAAGLSFKGMASAGSGYRAQLTKFACVKRDAQYVVQPGGTGEFPDSMVPGVQFGVTF